MEGKMQAGGLSDAERKAKGLLISSISSSKYKGIAMLSGWINVAVIPSVFLG